jgi:hypothetical protein
MVFSYKSSSFMDLFVTLATKIDLIINAEKSGDFSTAFVITIRDFEVRFFSLVKIKVD